MLTLTIVYENLKIFKIYGYQRHEACDVDVLLVCIGSAVDLLRTYGSKLIAEPSDNLDEEEEVQKPFVGGTSLTDLVQGLAELMDSEVGGNWIITALV